MSNISKRGFGTLKLKDPNRLKEISSKAGKAAWKKGTARHFDSKEAKAAGEKGLVVRRSHRAERNR